MNTIRDRVKEHNNQFKVGDTIISHIFDDYESYEIEGTIIKLIDENYAKIVTKYGNLIAWLSVSRKI